MASVIFLLLIAASLAIVLASSRGHGSGDIKEYVVASGQFGGLLLFFLAAGEIYSIGTMIGFPGGIYAKGPAYGVWFLGYILLAYPVGYFLNPLIWRAGRVYDAVTVSDLFKGHFQSRALELTVTISGIVFLIPWGQLQFTGFIVALNGLGWHFSPVLLVLVAALLAFGYIAVSGIRAPAFVSIMKDILMVLAIIVTGVAAASVEGVGPIFRAAGEHVRSRMTEPEQTFAMTTIFSQALGFYMLPFTMQVLFTARSEQIIRRTQIAMPVYMLMFPFLVLAAYFSLGHAAGLHSPNEAFMATVVQLLPSWLVGLVAAGAMLSGLVVLAGICLAIGPLVSRNMLRNVPESRQKRGAQIVIAAYLAVSIVLTLALPSLMVHLINTAYYGFSQFFPGIAAILFFRKVNPYAVMAGIIVADVLALTLDVTGTHVGSLNIGMVCLVLNAAIVVVGSALFSRGRAYTPVSQRLTGRGAILKAAAIAPEPARTI